MKIIDHSYIKAFKKNKYYLISAVFALWMIFFDTNSCIRHYELNQQVEKLEKTKNKYQEEINSDRKALDELNQDPDKLEKYARERFLMKKKDEEIFIIKKEE